MAVFAALPVLESGVTPGVTVAAAAGGGGDDRGDDVECAESDARRVLKRERKPVLVLTEAVRRPGR